MYNMIKMELTKSFEDYLETIYILIKKNREAKVKDIAKSLDVKLPSVTQAIKKLSKLGFINYQKYSNVELTKKGENYAKKVYEKHKIFLEFLTKILKVDEKTAIREACKIEHVVSKGTMVKLKKFMLSKNLKEVK